MVKGDKKVLMTPVHPGNSDPHVARNCSNLPVCLYRPLACGAMVSAVFVSVVFSVLSHCRKARTMLLALLPVLPFSLRIKQTTHCQLCKRANNQHLCVAAGANGMPRAGVQSERRACSAMCTEILRQ